MAGEYAGRYKGYNDVCARAHKNYMARFCTIQLRLDKEQRDKIKAHAETTGESVNRFMIRAALETMERDKRRD